MVKRHDIGTQMQSSKGMGNVVFGWSLMIFVAFVICLNCESANSARRGLIRDCEIFANLRLNLQTALQPGDVHHLHNNKI